MAVMVPYRSENKEPLPVAWLTSDNAVAMEQESIPETAVMG